MRALFLIPLLSLLLLASCARSSKTEEITATEPVPLQMPAREAPVHSPMSDLKPVPQQASSVLVNAGSLPLVHLFDQGGRVRVLNATTKRTLLSGTVAPGSIISVSESGILIARQRRLTTPLDPKHRYEIWWDVATSR